jgi:hypothetical protein
MNKRQRKKKGISKSSTMKFTGLEPGSMAVISGDGHIEIYKEGEIVSTTREENSAKP